MNPERRIINFKIRKFGFAILFVLLAGCASAPPPAALPEARRQAQFMAANANKLSQAQNWSAAVREWQRTADQYGTLNDLTNQAIALHNLAQAHRALGTVKTASDLFERASALNQETRQTNEWWRNQIALLQIEAEASTTEALKERLDRLSPQLPAQAPPVLRGLYLNELGLWQTRQREFSAAAGSFQQAESAFGKGGSREGVAAVTLNRARLLTTETNYAAAAKEWDRALAQYEALADPEGIAIALAGQGGIWLASNQDLNAAENRLRRAVDNFRTLKKLRHQIDALQMLLECVRAQKKPDVLIQSELAQAHEVYARSLEALGTRESARAEWQAAASLWDSLRETTARDKALAAAQRLTK